MKQGMQNLLGATSPKVVVIGCHEDVGDASRWEGRLQVGRHPEADLRAQMKKGGEVERGDSRRLPRLLLARAM